MSTTIAIVLGVILSFVLSAVLGVVIVPWLHKLKFGQTILDIGPNWHKKKQGTPTMGGFMFIIASIVTFLIIVLVDHFKGGDIVGGASPIANLEKVKLYSGLILALGFGIIGFFDDYIKVAKKRNEGLSVIQKSVAQVVIILAYIITLCYSSEQYIHIPFKGFVSYGSPIVFGLFAFCVIYATVNAVNFTDGIDGLCASVTVTASAAFAIMGILNQCMGVGLAASILAGACAGYLIWNWHPAKCFMGDTGSMFLGGMIAAFAFALNRPLILLLAGIIYVTEGLSDVIQIVYFKITKKIARKTDPNATGKRLFKMAPIHHHFEKCGWSEEKIVITFSLINLVGGVLACLMVYYNV